MTKLPMNFYLGYGVRLTKEQTDQVKKDFMTKQRLIKTLVIVEMVLLVILIMAAF